MQSEIIFIPLAQIKRQTSSILRRIKHKKQWQIRRERSFGYEIAEDYSSQLRRNIHKANTECIKLQNYRQQKKRLSLPNPNNHNPAHFFQHPSQKGQKSPSRKTSLKVLYDDPVRSHQKSIYLSLLQKKFSKSRLQPIPKRPNKGSDKLLLQEFKSIECQNIQDEHKNQKPLLRQQNGQELSDIKDYPLQQNQHLTTNVIIPKQKPIFLPFLEDFIKEQQEILTISSKIIRNLIVQMIILALERRKNGNLYDALDILLQTDLYEDNNKEMKLMKSSWLLMISKIYEEIKLGMKQQKKVSRWKKRESIKQTHIKSRQKTILIRSLASRRAFMYKCSIKLRQSSLINETTYLTQLRMYRCHEEKDKDGAIQTYITVRVTPKFQVNFPQPKVYFSDESLNNYSIIIIKKDSETNLFPLVYPSLLENCMPKKQYQQKICKINSYLIPSTRCFTFDTSLYQHYEEIFMMVFSIVLVAVLIIAFHYPSQDSVHHYYWIILFGSVSILIFGYIVLDTKNLRNHKHHNEIYENMQRVFRELGKEYQSDDYEHMKFKINQDLDVIIINTPIFFDMESQQNSEIEQPVSLIGKGKKISIKICQQYSTMFQKKDQVNQASLEDNKQKEEKVSLDFNFDFELDQQKAQEKEQNEGMKVITNAQNIESFDRKDFREASIALEIQKIQNKANKDYQLSWPNKIQGQSQCVNQKL